jgi:hypothetical protein
MNNYSYDCKEPVIPKSLPIKIVKKNNVKNQSVNNITDEYLLDFNTFNPSKFSPPSEWKFRLESRIKSYENLQVFVNN